VVPRLPDGQPYIGPPPPCTEARRSGVWHTLVNAALTWTYNHGYQWFSVDFNTANPLPRSPPSDGERPSLFGRVQSRIVASVVSRRRGRAGHIRDPAP
jgi:hypothetical protein